ncbi:MAG: transporter [Frankiales bacterium]|nr:transporter [Frankiales bacterium]
MHWPPARACRRHVPETRTDLGSPPSVGVVFAAAGVVSAAGFSRIPSLRDQVDASAAELSLALVCVGLGSLLLMPATGRLSERFSSALVLRVSGAVCLAGWAVAAFAPSVPVLAACLLLTGMGTGVWDVAMNIQGHTVEQRQRRVLMPGWHAAFSFGAVGGALTGAAFARLGLSVELQFPLVSVVALAVLLWCSRRFVDDEPAAAVAPATGELGASAVPPDPPGRSGITRPELLIGLMVLATALGEGAANDWLGLTLVDERGLPETFGALTLAFFNLTIGITRIVGGRLIARIGRVLVLQVSGATAAFGILLLCLVDSPVAAAVGAACWGLGLAVVFPSGMSAAGEVPGRGARAISVVSTIGYTGFLLGAPLIGQLTHVLPLDRALLVVAGFALLIVVVAPAARERTAAAP